MPLFQALLRRRNDSSEQALNIKPAIPFWNMPLDELFTVLGTSYKGCCHRMRHPNDCISTD